MTEYKVIAIRSDGLVLCTVDKCGRRSLPRVVIPPNERHAEALQKAIRLCWGLPVIVLTVLSDPDSRIPCVVVDVLELPTNTCLVTTALERIPAIELCETLLFQLERLFAGDMERPFSRIGWIQEAIGWLEDTTGTLVGPKDQIQQLNAAECFALIRFVMLNGNVYWLKATGIPNKHEYSITRYLCHLDKSRGRHCYMPSLIATKPEWNAWLMSGEGRSISEFMTRSDERLRALKGAVRSLAELQIAAVGHDQDLLRAGAFDQRIEVLIRQAGALFEYLDGAMSLQTSTKAEPIGTRRLMEIRDGVIGAFEQIGALGIPSSIVHGDLNSGNIVMADHCQFIDWSEAYVGCPLISLEHLLLLNQSGNDPLREQENLELKRLYSEEWNDIVTLGAIEEGLRYMPLVAPLSTLYGRGDWLEGADREKPNRLSYARTLARHMDRALGTLEMQESICR